MASDFHILFFHKITEAYKTVTNVMDISKYCGFLIKAELWILFIKIK